MSVAQKFPKTVSWCVQRCPLCGEDKIVITHGMVNDEKELKIYPDRGYSFCNCKNIWFTNWSNIDPETKPKENSTEVLRYYICDTKIFNMGYGKNKFQCLGNDPVEKEAERLGWDIKPAIKYDVIWAYHYLEHIKDPIEMLRHCYTALNKEGILFIAMPDPYFIEFENAYWWKHWLLREHYIMWDMDSFCDELIKLGFKIQMANRNFAVNIKRDYHIICQK